MSGFVHLHVHTQYSILDGASNIKVLIDTAKALGMKAVAVTDHGNMFGIKEFIKTVEKINDHPYSDIIKHKKEIEKLILSDPIANSDEIQELQSKITHEEAKLFKPIMGVEAYIAKNSRFDRTEKEDRAGFHLILLAKNKEGYHNLIKLVTYSWTEGFYYKPRMDKELLRKYSKGIIASSACLGGEIPDAIMMGNIKLAEDLINDYKSIFGDDFYLELMLHKSGDYRIDQDVYQNQLKVNKALIELSKKTGVKCIATNDVHFVKSEDAPAHDRLICLNTSKDLDDPDRLRYTTQEYLKSEEEMRLLFPDFEEAILNTAEVASKVEFINLNNSPIMPYFPLPEGFEDDNAYLHH